jgi:hypothetical protein
VWIPCLPKFPDGYDRRSWADECARLWWESSGLSHGAAEITALAAALHEIHEASYGRVPCHLAFIHLPDPRLAPLPVYLGIWALEGDRDARLRDLTRADDTETIRPPIVDEFTAPALGTGLRTLRHKRRDDGPVWAALRYAWRSDQYETDVQLWTSTADLGRLQRAISDIDTFARVVTVIPRSQLRHD